MADATTAAPTIGVVDFVKLVIDTVQQVEGVFPAGSGKDKFDAVYTQIMAFAPLVTLGASLIEQWLPILINTTVANFNRFKAWIHPASATAPATPAAA